MTDIAGVGGVGLVGYGLWLVHPAALFIVGGLALVCVSVWWTWTKQRGKE